MHALAKQKGLSAIGWLFVLGTLAFYLMLLMKIGTKITSIISLMSIMAAVLASAILTTMA